MATATHQPLTEDQKRQKALEDYRKKLIEHRELDAKLKKSEWKIMLSQEIMIGYFYNKM